MLSKNKFVERFLLTYFQEVNRELGFNLELMNNSMNWCILILSLYVSTSIILWLNLGETPFALDAFYALAIIVFTFILRFTIRALISFKNILKFKYMHDLILETIIYDENKHSHKLASLKKAIKIYDIEWRSHIPLRELIKKFSKIGFIHMLCIVTIMLLYAIYLNLVAYSWSSIDGLLSGLLIADILAELWALVTSEEFMYTEHKC